jgi:hypothetical protein
VFSSGNFSLSGGTIFGNTASTGGGVCNYGNFSMFGGVISGNLATWFGSISGSEQSDFGIGYGGGVYVGDGVFQMFGGVISGNVATWSGDVPSGYGGGVYVEDGIFKLTGGEISDNIALVSGGGVGVSDVANLGKIFVSDGVIFSNNSASVAYNRNSVHDVLYNSNIGSNVTWTIPFTQGYNNYDISYTSNSPIDQEQNTGDKKSGVNVYFALGVIFVLTLVIVAVLFFHLKKRKPSVEKNANNHVDS